MSSTRTLRSTERPRAVLRYLEDLPEAPNADFVTGEVIAHPLGRCHEYGGGPAPCRTRDDGSVLQSYENRPGGRRGA